MTMVLELTEDQKERLQRYAAQLGKNPQSLLLEWVDTLPKTSELPQGRVPGLGSGNILFMSPDFDAPLFEDFCRDDALPKTLESATAAMSVSPPFPNLVAYIAPDFNEPLTDEFWGESETDASIVAYPVPALW